MVSCSESGWIGVRGIKLSFGESKTAGGMAMESEGRCRCNVNEGASMVSRLRKRLGAGGISNIARRLSPRVEVLCRQCARALGIVRALTRYVGRTTISVSVGCARSQVKPVAGTMAERCL